MVQRTLKGLWRLAVLLAHILAGVWTVYMRFPHMTLPQRRAAVQQWAAGVVRRCGMALQVQGRPAQPGTGVLLVSNHLSWLDIPVLHAVHFCRFVSKSEVRHWPVIGRLASAADTLYLERESRRDAHRVLHAMAEHLRQGEVLAVFPEGTTSDGHDVLPFHANLLQAAISAQVPIQPVALQFLDTAGRLSSIPCYIGEDSLLVSLWRTVCADGLQVRVCWGELQQADGRTRQQWAHALREAVVALRD